MSGKRKCTCECTFLTYIRQENICRSMAIVLTEFYLDLVLCKIQMLCICAS